MNNGPPDIPLIPNVWFRRFWLSWATIHASTGEGDAGNLVLAQTSTECGERSSLLLARHLETVDGDALLPRKGALAVVKNPRSVINAKGSCQKREA